MSNVESKQKQSDSQSQPDGFVAIRGARQNNLKNIDANIPREKFVVFTGVSGSGKSSLAFGTIYAESQRRYFESIAPYARRLIAQLPAPHVTEISGLPPAVALEQRRVDPSFRSTVGTLTTLSNSLRMLFSRAGTYPTENSARLDSDSFSYNTPAGACDECHGMGAVYDVTEESLVPDPSLTIKEKAIAAWPGAWQGKNYRDILATLGYDVDKPWKDLPQKDREWILFTDEKPVVTVHAEREAHRIQRPYKGTYMSAAAYVRHTFSTTNSSTLRKRVAQFMERSVCDQCQGKRLKKDALAVKFQGYDITELGQMQLSDLSSVLNSLDLPKESDSIDSVKVRAATLIVSDLLDRIDLLSNLGLDYLSLDRPTPTLSSGELQRLRLTTQLRSGLFGVVYVLDEPSAGLHPADTEALLAMMRRLQTNGNSLFVVEHEMDLVEQADWIVDMGPGAGDEGGELIYSGPPSGLAQCENSLTRDYLFNRSRRKSSRNDSTDSAKRKHDPRGSLKLIGASANNLKNLDVSFPLGTLTVVTGISGAGKSTLVSKVLAETVKSKLGAKTSEEETDDEVDDLILDEDYSNSGLAGIEGLEHIRRLVCVDQKPIGRTPRSNLATYTGLFDHIRKLYASKQESKKRKFSAGRFSFNVKGGRCAVCEGEGFVSIELMFLPSVYAPCTACKGTRYNEETLEILHNGLNVAEVLDLSVDAASEFFEDQPAVARALSTLSEVGLGYLKLGQPATELSGGEAQRIKLATELQRVQKGDALYLLDEPTTGLHPADVEKLLKLLHRLVEAGNTVIIVEHDLDVISSADWILDIGPGAGAQGGEVVAEGTPETIASSPRSRTAPYLMKHLNPSRRETPSHN